MRIIETNSTIITTTPITKTGPISLRKKNYTALHLYIVLFK